MAVHPLASAVQGEKLSDSVARHWGGGVVERLAGGYEAGFVRDLNAGGPLAGGWGPARFDGQFDYFAGRRALHLEVDRAAHVEADLAADVGCVLHLVAVELQDRVARLDAGDVGRGSGLDDADDGRPNGDVAWEHKGDGEKQDGQDDVHEGARTEDDQPLPGMLGGEALRVRRVFFAEQAHEAS